MMKSEIKATTEALLRRFGPQRVQTNYHLREITALKIGGPAQIFFSAKSAEEIVEATILARNHNVPVTLLGSATNVVIADSGLPGLVIRNEAKMIRLAGLKGVIRSRQPTDESVIVEVESGVLTNQLVRYTLDEGLSGLEPFLGQPGTVGGAVCTDAKLRQAYFRDQIIEAKILTYAGDIRTELGAKFSNRQDIILSIRLRLTKGSKDELWKSANEIVRFRSFNQPRDLLSTGSAFKNISLSEAWQIPTPNYTTAVEYLLDRVRLRGYHYGGAKFSDRHTNFIINCQKAKSADVLFLIEEAKRRVKNEFGINLTEEITFLGDYGKNYRPGTE